MNTDLTLFEDHPIRRVYDEEADIWWFSVIDIIQVLTQQSDYQTARKYWNKLKQRLTKEGSESVTNCHRLKLPAADGKNYLTDVATAETLLRLVQSVPSPKAEPIKLWLAKVGYERMQEMADPSRSLDRARTRRVSATHAPVVCGITGETAKGGTRPVACGVGGVFRGSGSGGRKYAASTGCGGGGAEELGGTGARALGKALVLAQNTPSPIWERAGVRAEYWINRQDKF